MFKSTCDYKNKLVIVSLLIIVIATSLNIYYKKQLYNQHPPTIANDTAYYQGQDIEKLLSENSNFNVEYEYSIPYIYDKSLKVEEPYTVSTDIKIPLGNIKWLKKSSVDVINDISEKINKNKINEQVNLSYVNFPKSITKVDIENEYLGINYLICGEYPQNAGDILVPEIFALVIIQKNNYNSYDQLIGTSTNIAINGVEKEYNITGIYAGNSATVYTPITNKVATMYKQEGIEYDNKKAIILEFSDRAEVTIFMAKNHEYQLYTSKDYVFSQVKNKIIYLFIILEYSLYFLLLSKQIKITKQVLDHYHISLRNSIITYGLNLFIASVIIIFSLSLTYIV